MKKAEAWILERLNGEGGLGAYFQPWSMPTKRWVCSAIPLTIRCAHATTSDRRSPGGEGAQRLLPALCITRVGYRVGLYRAPAGR